MWFVLIVVIIVIAGWIFLASHANTRNPSDRSDPHVPVNAYDNPYDSHENNDRPFEPDNAPDASTDSTSDTCSDSSSSDT
jgi:hypothetical protein